MSLFGQRVEVKSTLSVNTAFFLCMMLNTSGQVDAGDTDLMKQAGDKLI